jgi:hypothetical protein
MACTRFEVKKGVRETLLATFDVTNLPSGSLSGVTIDWYVKRTLGQPSYDIHKVSTSASEIVVVNASLGTVNVYLYPEDTQSLTPGDYYYAFKLTSVALGVLTVSPDTSHGDFVLLNSAYL